MLFFHFFLPVVYSLLFFISFRDPLTLGLFSSAVFLGYWMLHLDFLFYPFYSSLETEWMQHVRYLLRQRKIGAYLNQVWSHRHETQTLITRSIPFIGAYFAAAIFMITSSASIIGLGVVLGMGLHLVFDAVRFRSNLVAFQQRFLPETGRTLTSQQVTYLVVAMVSFFIILTLLGLS